MSYLKGCSTVGKAHSMQIGVVLQNNMPAAIIQRKPVTLLSVAEILSSSYYETLDVRSEAVED
jgi:hypothetical protein